MSKKVIFVDDEASVLRGLRRAMFEMSSEWEMEFASSGAAALQILEQEPYDVIVSDMRMPEMDGAELLQEVSKRYPRMVRIVLSGQSDKELIMKSVAPTHQYLTKPCNVQNLSNILENAMAIRNLLDNPELQQIVSNLKSIPSPPTLYQEVVLEMQAPDFKLARIGELIATDPGMSAKILQMVNSSFFGLATRVSDPVHAAKMLGADILRGLILTVKVFSEFDELRSKNLSLRDFSNHSIAVASLAKEIAKVEINAKEVIDDSFVAGIMHDIGKLIFAQNLPEQYDTAMAYAREHQICRCEAEKKIVGSSHAEVGAYLLGLWGLPHTVVRAIAYHHDPAISGDCEFGALAALHISNSLVLSAEMDSFFIERLGLLKRVPVWTKLAEEGKHRD